MVLHVCGVLDRYVCGRSEAQGGVMRVLRWSGRGDGTGMGTMYIRVMHVPIYTSGMSMQFNSRSPWGRTDRRWAWCGDKKERMHRRVNS